MSGGDATRSCRRCGGRTCEHHELLARAFGLGPGPICFACISSGLALDSGELADATFGYVANRDCYRREWQEIGRCSAGGEGLRPVCLPVAIPGRHAVLAEPPEGPTEAPGPDVGRRDELGRPPDWEHQAEFDGGDQGCGDLLLDLREFVLPLPAGTRILVTATDPGAPIDLPAWCRITGHALLHERHPHYLIQRRED